MLLLCEGLLEQALDDLEIDVRERGDDADVRDILHQDSRARAIEPLVAHARERHADDRNVIPVQLPAARPGRVVDQPSARLDVRHVLGVGLGIHRDHHVDPIRTGLVAVLGYPDLVPRGQALDIRRKIILADDGDAHAEYRLAQKAVRARRAGAVYRGDLDDNVVGSCHSMTLASGSGFAGLFRFCPDRFVLRVWKQDLRFLHVPGAGRAALGAQAAVHADILVLDHHT